MGSCISKDAEAGIKKFNRKSKKHSKEPRQLPDGTSAENTDDLYTYSREKPSCSSKSGRSSPAHSSHGRTFYEGPSMPLRKYDRVIWIDEDNSPEKGTFKWIGILDGERCVGLQLDNKRTVSFGDHTGRKLFSCKPGHRAVVPLYQVMLVKDFETKLSATSASSPSKTQPGKSQQQQVTEPRASNKPKRRMRESVDRFYNGQDTNKKTKVGGDTSTSQQPSTSFQSTTIDSYTSSNVMASSTPKTGSEKLQLAPVPRKRTPAVPKEPDWTAGDRIKFRHSKDEAEILETKLEYDSLMAKIQYTEDSTRPGEVEVSPLLDIMMESSLVKPPVLQQPLRRSSFLEAVSSEPLSESYSTSTSTNTLRKDEAIQTSLTALDEILLPPSFQLQPGFPITKQQSSAAQTSFEYPPPKPTNYSYYSSSNSRPTSLQVQGRQKTRPIDVVDYVKPWPGYPNAEDKGEFSYPVRWTESFRKSQKQAATVGALKLQEQKRKLEKSLSSDELGDGNGNGNGDSNNHHMSADGATLELERACIQSPLKHLDDLAQRPLESPTLVKLARRNTYPLTASSLMPSFLASAHPFSKERVEFFDVNMNTNTKYDGAKIVDIEMKQSTSTYPATFTVSTSKPSKPKSNDERSKSGPPELTTKVTRDTNYSANTNGQPACGPELQRDTQNQIGNFNVNQVNTEVHQELQEESGKRRREYENMGNSLSRPSSKKRRKLCRPRLQKNTLNIYPPFSVDDIQFGLGSQRGIGGMRNSCYLDATLFALFYCTDIFDTTILFNTTDEDLAKLATKYLQSIVFHLRGGGFCEGERVMKLRNAMKSDKVKGHFMDVEEFMFNLFDQTLKLPEFIHYYPDTKDYLSQVFIDNNDPRKYATVQELLETSFKLQDDLKLASIPFPAWIIEMPRSNGRLVHYDAIIPTVHLNMNDLMIKVSNDVTASCFCEIGMPPFWACQICHDESDHFNQKLTFCSHCKDSLITSLHDEMNHLPDPVLFDPVTNSLVGNETISSELTMDLLAVICFKACHYTCFVKCGSGKESTWIYFDSMTGTSSMVEEVTEMTFWLKELEKDPKIYKNKNVPTRVKQILFDSHIYIYSPTPPACPKSTAV